MQRKTRKRYEEERRPRCRTSRMHSPDTVADVMCIRSLLICQTFVWTSFKQLCNYIHISYDSLEVAEIATANYFLSVWTMRMRKSKLNFCYSDRQFIFNSATLITHSMFLLLFAIPIPNAVKCVNQKKQTKLRRHIDFLSHVSVSVVENGINEHN